MGSATSVRSTPIHRCMYLLRSQYLLSFALTACTLPYPAIADGGPDAYIAFDAGCISSSPDLCNGVDDDCDGRADDGASQYCSLFLQDHEVGVCHFGACTARCEPGYFTCEGDGPRCTRPSTSDSCSRCGYSC